MGAWRHDVFGNDDACDWVNDLEESEDIGLIVEAFEHVESEGYLASPAGCIGVDGTSKPTVLEIVVR